MNWPEDSMSEGAAMALSIIIGLVLVLCTELLLASAFVLKDRLHKTPSTSSGERVATEKGLSEQLQNNRVIHDSMVTFLIMVVHIACVVHMWFEINKRTACVKGGVGCLETWIVGMFVLLGIR